MGVLGYEKGCHAVFSSENGMCLVLTMPFMQFVALRRNMSLVLKGSVKQFVALRVECAWF